MKVGVTGADNCHPRTSVTGVSKLELDLHALAARGHRVSDYRLIFR
jgi:hypothetical protein